MKHLIIFILFSMSVILISVVFSEEPSPSAQQYIQMKKKVAMLEAQLRIHKEGWDGCLQAYELLMGDCSNACRIGGI